MNVFFQKQPYFRIQALSDSSHRHCRTAKEMILTRTMNGITKDDEERKKKKKHFYYIQVACFAYIMTAEVPN